MFSPLLPTLVVCALICQGTALQYTSTALWNQLQEDYPEVAQELLERMDNVVQMHRFENVKRSAGEPTDFGYARTTNTRPLLMKFLGFGLKRSDLPEMSGYARRRRSEKI